MECQKHLFSLPDNIHYLNCSYMSPLLKSVEETGIEGIQFKRNPAKVRTEDFFEELVILKEHFASLVGGPSKQMAFIPSVSYGMQIALSNTPCPTGHHAVTVSDSFPSGYYTLKRWCSDHNAELRVISPRESSKIGADWTNRIIEAILPDTAVIIVPHVHWMYGTRFDLEAIGQKCAETDTYLIVDGTQSVGALPVDVIRFKIDSLICAGYKWLMGPYSTGMAYFGPRYNEGRPLEETWMNRTNAENFSALTKYVDTYTPGAGRYNMGESSNFILVPMLHQAIRQVNLWGPSHIQAYCAHLIEPLIAYLHEIDAHVEDESYRVSHLLGLRLPPSLNMDRVMAQFEQHNIYISVRGNSIRLSPNVYNTHADIAALIYALQQGQQ